MKTKQSAIRLISTDFDGTFFAEFESPPVPDELQMLIGRLQKQGAKWAINTGRDMSSLMETLGRAALDIEPDYLVLVEREIHLRDASRYIAHEDWNSACQVAQATVFDQVRHDLPRLRDWINSRFRAILYDDIYSPLCLIAHSNGDMDQIHAFLEAYCRTVPHLAIVRNDVYARFSHDGFNKGTALGELTRRLGLTAENVFAIGDHLNDLPMLSPQFARFIAAPANAVVPVQAAVRRAGGYVSGQAHGRGVLEAMKYYLEGGPERG